LEELKILRAKYFKDIIDKDKKKTAKCIFTSQTPDGKEVQCGKVFGDSKPPSTDILNKHLAGHVTIPEFDGKKTTEGKIDSFLVSYPPQAEFKVVAISLVSNNNTPLALLDSPEWKCIVAEHLKMDNFGSHAGKGKMTELNTTGTKNFKFFLNCKCYMLLYKRG
jgi:hypothetical protein